MECSITASFKKCVIRNEVLLLSVSHNVQYEVNITTLRLPVLSSENKKTVKMSMERCVWDPPGDLRSDDMMISSLLQTPQWCRQRQ